ncbi:MAG: sel1 repeat family protein [Deltaproteobacteria bacterium]|jgi:TPR repeat protein|nr:sel1 repeat family protein [Deltaproteobacteria bacterium]
MSKIIVFLAFIWAIVFGTLATEQAWAQFDHDQFSRHQDDVKVFEAGREPGQESFQQPDDFGIPIRLGGEKTDSEPAASAAENLNKLADEGDPNAMYELSLLYFTGTGVQLDPVKGIELLKQAANAGSASAQYRLAIIYYFGEGVAEDKSETVKLLQSAAEKSEPEAQFMLGVMYANGDGVEKNHAEATRLFRLSAAQGNISAQEILNANGLE